MNTFLLRSACFLFGVWVLSNSLAGLAERTAPMDVYGRSQAERLRRLIANSATTEAIALGNSHSDAIDFNALAMNGQRLARAGTDLFEVFQYARSVVPLLPKLKTTFIAVSYFSFARDNTLSDDTRNLRIELYALLPTWTSLPGDAERLLLGKLHRYFRILSVVRPDNWQGVFSADLASIQEAESSPAALTESVTPWGACFHYTASQLATMGHEIGYKAADNHLEFLALDPSIEVRTYEALADTIEILKRRGIRVILFTPPYYVAYSQRFRAVAPEMIERMQQSVENLRTQFNVEYYDGVSLPEFSTHPELFFNSDHLNECGMRGFAEYLQKQMANADRPTQ